MMFRIHKSMMVNDCLHGQHVQSIVVYEVFPHLDGHAQSPPFLQQLHLLTRLFDEKETEKRTSWWKKTNI